MKDTRNNYDKLQKFINKVFNTKENTFDLIHPSLHKKKYNPTDYTSVIKCKDEYVACGTLVKYNLDILNNNLLVGSIGNIATSSNYTNKGYMKQIMDELIIDSKDCDIVCLVGDRLRYNRYNFDTTGVEHQYILSRKNTRKVYSNKDGVSIKESCEIDSDKLFKLYNKQSYKTIRNKESFYDKLHTWQSSVYTIYKNNDIIGYFVLNNNEVIELVIDDIYFTSLLCELFTTDYITINISDNEIIKREILNKICVHYYLRSEVRYLINNFKSTIEKLLMLKLSYTTLPDVNLSIKVNGIDNIEHFKISITNNKLEITDTNIIDYDLSYFEALEFFFSINSLYKLENYALNIFPLPLYINKLDII